MMSEILLDPILRPLVFVMLGCFYFILLLGQDESLQSILWYQEMIGPVRGQDPLRGAATTGYGPCYAA